MRNSVQLSLTTRLVPTRFDVVQYATAPEIEFCFTDFTPTGRARIYIEKPSGAKVYNQCTIDGQKVVFTPTTQAFAEVGLNKCQLEIMEGESIAVSFLIYANVIENIIDEEAIESSDEFTALEEALATIGRYDERIDKVENDVADALEEVDTSLADALATVTQDLTDAKAEIDADIATMESSLNDFMKYALAWTDPILLTSSDDLHTLSTGIYYYNTNSIPQNAYHVNASVVIVFRAPNLRTPTLILSTRFGVAGKMAFQVYGSGNWQDWKEVGLAEDITAINSFMNRFLFASGINQVNFGDAGNTTSTFVWGNTTNKVGVGATNATDNARHNLLVRASSLILNKDTGTQTVLWSLTGLFGGMDLSKHFAQTGEEVSLASNISAGYLTNGSKALVFSKSCPKHMSNGTVTLTYLKVTARSAQGGYPAIDTGASAGTALSDAVLLDDSGLASGITSIVATITEGVLSIRINTNNTVKVTATGGSSASTLTNNSVVNFDSIVRFIAR